MSEPTFDNALSNGAIGDFFGSRYERRRGVIGYCNDYANPSNLNSNRENQQEFAGLIDRKNNGEPGYDDLNFYLPDNETYSYIKDQNWHGRFKFTDDTMLGFAIAYTLNSQKYLDIIQGNKELELSEEELETLYEGLDEDVFVNFCKFSHRYHDAYGDCGPRFIRLLDDCHYTGTEQEIRERYRAIREQNKNLSGNVPTKSWGNGSAMRVAACGNAANSLEEARVLAKMVSINTHDNKLAIEGAQAVASVIFLSRLGLSKETIKAYINYVYKTNEPFNRSGTLAEDLAANYDMDKTIGEVIWGGYPYCIRCDLTVVQALRAFFESDSYTSALDNALKLAADSDTIGKMVADMAAAYYGTPKNLSGRAYGKLADINKQSNVLITGEQDNTNSGRDALMQRVNDEFDQNFREGYRDRADKGWQLEQIGRIFADLGRQRLAGEPIHNRKTDEYNVLTNLLEADKKRIELKENLDINPSERPSENNLPHVDPILLSQKMSLFESVSYQVFNLYGGLEYNTLRDRLMERIKPEEKNEFGFYFLTYMDQVLEHGENNLKNEGDIDIDYIDQIKHSLIFFVDVFDIKLEGKTKENLISDIESQYDVGFLRTIFEQIKNVFMHGIFMGYNKTKNTIRIKRFREQLSSKRTGLVELFGAKPKIADQNNGDRDL